VCVWKYTWDERITVGCWSISHPSSCLQNRESCLLAVMCNQTFKMAVKLKMLVSCFYWLWRYLPVQYLTFRRRRVKKKRLEKKLPGTTSWLPDVMLGIKNMFAVRIVGHLKFLALSMRVKQYLALWRLRKSLRI